MFYKLSPSVLAADFSRLGEEIETVERAGAPYIHLDVMDGHFVPSLSIGLPMIESLRKRSDMIFDVHLMIENPDYYLEPFAVAGADIITVHAEASTHLDRTLRAIHALGKKTGVALNPATPLTALDWILPQADMVLLMTVNPGFGGQEFIPYLIDKIYGLREIADKYKLDTDIEVDGGVTLKNADAIMAAGANVLVAGSAVFRGNPAENTKKFMELMRAREEIRAKQLSGGEGNQ